MSSSLIDVEDRLLHAKNLLKKYQSKQNANSSSNDTRLTNRKLAESLNVNYDDNRNLPNTFNSSANSSRPSSVLERKTSNSSSIQSMSHASHNHSENPDVIQLTHLLQEKEHLLNETLKKLHELHKHYSELHSAYNIATQTAQANAPAEYALHISQLQTALAVVIEEKTSLQLDLRNARSRLEVLENERKVNSEDYKNSLFLSTKIESELNQLKDERNRLFETVASQSSQIEIHRKECSNLEAKIILINQDRNETQARLKYLYDEKSILEKDLEKLRNNINMKDIYIRQLTRFSQTDPEQDQLVIQALSDEKKRCEVDVENKKAEIVELKKQFESTRQHYELCISEMGRQITSLEFEVNNLKTYESELKSVNAYQDEQLKLLRTSLENQSSKKDEEKALEHQRCVDMEGFLLLQNNFELLQNDLSRCRERVQDLEGLIEQKESQLESLQYDFIDAQRKIADLEESIHFHKSMNSENLSEQLQNEKATVSRAVAQNLELKEQLFELQNRIVQVIDESAEKENKWLAAIATVKSLRHQQTIPLTNISNFPEDVVSSDTFQNEDNVQANDDMPINSTEVAANLIISNTDNDNQAVDNNTLITKTVSQNDSFVKGVQSVFYDDNVDNSKLKITDKVSIKSISSIANENKTDYAFVHNSLDVASLKSCLSEVEREKEKYRLDSERLEHLLTILESENESIGEYIAIYQFQRANFQKKVVEKESALTMLQQENSNLFNQLSELQTAVLSLTKKEDNNKLLTNYVPSKLIHDNNQLNEIKTSLDSYVNDNTLATFSTNGLHNLSLNLSKDEVEGTPNSIQHENVPDDDVKEIQCIEESLCNQPTTADVESWAALNKLLQIVLMQKVGSKKKCSADLALPPTMQCSGCVECRGQLLSL